MQVSCISMQRGMLFTCRLSTDQDNNIDGKVLEARDSHKLGKAVVHSCSAGQAAPHLIYHHLYLHHNQTGFASALSHTDSQKAQPAFLACCKMTILPCWLLHLSQHPNGHPSVSEFSAACTTGRSQAVIRRCVCCQCARVGYLKIYFCTQLCARQSKH